MPPSSTDITTANRSFFDDLATRYDIKPWQKQYALQLTIFIQQSLDFIAIPKHPDPITLLDYACGTGMVSRALGPFANTIQAIDLSSKMVERFNELATSSEIPSVRKARAVEGDLLSDQEYPASSTGPELYNFDIAAVGGGLHHFDDPAKAIRRLAERLNVGGVLLIVDFVEEDQAWVPSHADHTIRKHGFSEKEMREMMEGCGLGRFGWKEMSERVEIRMHEDRPFSRKGFMARATRV